MFRVRNKSSLLFVDWKRFASSLLPSVCVKWCVFSKHELISAISAHVFTANHITYLPTATLSTDQSNRSPGFLNFQLTNTNTWLWRWLPHRLSKRQSLTTVLLRTPITQMIFFNEGMNWSSVSSIVLVTLKDWLILTNKLNYTHTNVGEKVQPY